MRILRFIIQKEFIQIFRNRAILPLMTIMPIVQLILLSFAASNEVKDVKLAVVNHNPSSYSRLLIEKIQYSDRFILVDMLHAHKQADEMMQAGEIDIILEIPPDFERNFHRYRSGQLQVLVNAINGQQATVGASYLASVIQSFNQELKQDVNAAMPIVKTTTGSVIQIESANWFNRDLNYKYFMVPGILAQLVTILSILLTAINVVREREIGTIEQINVTPIKKWQFIMGKLIPFMVIGLFLMVVGLTAGKLIFDVPMEGNLGTVFAFCVLNLSAVLGLGLLISNLADTQQQATFITFFFVIIFVLMSGLFTPIESMPMWAQYLTIPNPVAHFVHVMRSVLLKGSGFADIAWNFQIIVILSIIFNALAVSTYKKVN
ncbi:MAG: ABC transporter permease [Bacteroidota bacterium]